VSIRGRITLGAVAAGLLLWAALEISPWPSALLIRWAFDISGERANARLASRVPAGIEAAPNETYDPGDPDTRLDVFYPGARAPAGGLLTVVWIHGGGFVSGSKDQISNYARILAAGGFAVAGVDYSLAPKRTYPTPLVQVNRALAYLAHNAQRLHVDPERLVLAGDSAGAQLAAQLANVITSPTYARTIGIAPAISPRQLAGVLLYCGPYAMSGSPAGNPFARWFARTVQWSYSGRRDYTRDARGVTLAVAKFVTPGFPPTFISVGNADALAPQSYALAIALHGEGVRVDALFFPPDYHPGLPHEYQFFLDTEEARLALSRSQEFLMSLR
jgi:acetyl esterase